MDAADFNNHTEPTLNPAGSPVVVVQPRRQHATRRRWIASGAAVLVLAVAGLGASTQPTGTPLSTLSTTVQAQTDQTQMDPVTSAIEQVIQRGNDEQAQAISSGDPSVMSDTATADHYQELLKINQGLVANGVSAISLDKLEWGPVAVNGTTATATTYETWSTTASDGTTMQSRDTNVYTLVQQGGTWVVQTDAQPAQATGQPGQPAASVGGQAPSTSQPSPGQPQPFETTSRNTSHNWSGYAATSGTGNYTGVTGTWTVPQPQASDTSAGVSAAWVGIGGVNSRDLIQAGTQEVVSGAGQSQYQTWIETLPQASKQIPLAVKPGDSVTVSIDKQAIGANMWDIDFKNNTSGQTYQTSVRYTSTQSSAEWIEEAPSGQGGILPIDNFGSIAFTSASATQAGQSVDLTQTNAQPISLLGANGQALAVPSAVGSDGSSFSVARTDAPAVTTTPRTQRGRGGFPTIPNNPRPVIPFE